ncbi:MAG: response regulator [Nitrospirota bacterium]|nr:response regulator [Nitrospirota bacterium]
MEDRGRKNVLVVDDSALMRMLISMTIKKNIQGIAVTEAVNGADAITKMQDQDFDLILTDMVMPGMDGLQMVSAIRDSVSKTIPIVIITTKGEARERDLGLLHGADSYITKPVNAHELKETVLKFLK